MIVAGKRHDFLAEYEVGFDPDGRIHAVRATLAARCGFAADLSGPVTDRALFHADNAYHYPAVRLVSEPWRTNTCSNTAFRGFGGPQGVLVAERIVEEVAFATGLDPLEVRRRNLYREGDLTPYHQPIENVPLETILDELERRAAYRERRRAIAAFNAESPVLKKGIALTPVKFGISFTATWYNQAGALLHVYRDGSVLIAQGGVEMGQGLFVKVAQVVAHELALDLERIRLATTDTGKVPNTSTTAASSGSDLNGMAAQVAARTLEERLSAFAAERWSVPAEQIVWLPGRLRVGNQEILWEELVAEAYRARVQLWASGFYRTPEIHWDRKAGRGRPFYYFACGAACAEVTVDTLTGAHRIDRVDVLHDCGRSLNPGRRAARLRPLAQPGGRSRTDRRRARPGDRLAHERGARVGRGGPAAHPQPLHLQDPDRGRPAAGGEHRPLRGGPQPQAHDPPQPGGGRATLDARDRRAARDLGCRGEPRRPPHLPEARPARHARSGARGGRAGPRRGCRRIVRDRRTMSELAAILAGLSAAGRPCS